MSEEDELKLAALEYKLKWTTHALLEVAREMSRSAISEYNPTPTELLQLAKWCFGLEAALEQEVQKIING